MKKFAVLLYYHYSPIATPEQFREEHHQLCLDLGLFGRIIIASEGINGTVSGTIESCEAYMNAVKAILGFETIDFKVDYSDENSFKKLYVRTKPEIVHSGFPEIDPNKRTGIHLEPEEFKKLKEQDDVVLLDVRSNYEHSIGRFKNAMTLDIENFRDLPEKLDEIAHLKDKKVITYCTGGIKCEKASAWLLEQGFENVYQLHGGIIKYGLEAGGEDFEGKCYVFDGRLTVDVNRINPKVISSCYICGTTSDRMVNCANPTCNMHVPICENCGVEYDGACSIECKNDPNKRPYNGTGYYQKELHAYNPKLNSKRKPVYYEA